MTTSSKQPEMPARFPGQWRSLVNIDSTNAYLMSLVNALMSYAFKQCGGRIRPSWTTSGIRYQYIPAPFPGKLDLVAIFERLLDLQGEIFHQMIQLNLERLNVCQGFDSKIFPMDMKTTCYIDINVAQRRSELETLIKRTIRALREIFELGEANIDRRERASEFFLQGLSFIKYYIPRFKDLDRAVQTHASQVVTEGDKERVRGVASQADPNTETTTNVQSR